MPICASDAYLSFFYVLCLKIVFIFNKKCILIERKLSHFSILIPLMRTNKASIASWSLFYAREFSIAAGHSDLTRHPPTVESSPSLPRAPTQLLLVIKNPPNWIEKIRNFFTFLLCLYNFYYKFFKTIFSSVDCVSDETYFQYRLAYSEGHSYNITKLTVLCVGHDLEYKCCGSGSKNILDPDTCVKL